MDPDMKHDRTTMHFLADDERPAIVACLSVVRSLRTSIGVDDDAQTDARLVETFFTLDATDWVDDPTVDWSLVFRAIARPESVAIAADFPNTRDSLHALVDELSKDGRSGDADCLRRAYAL